MKSEDASREFVNAIPFSPNNADGRSNRAKKIKDMMAAQELTTAAVL